VRCQRCQVRIESRPPARDKICCVSQEIGTKSAVIGLIAFASLRILHVRCLPHGSGLLHKKMDDAHRVTYTTSWNLQRESSSNGLDP
jgi:hypothetical protein